MTIQISSALSSCHHQQVLTGLHTVQTPIWAQEDHNHIGHQATYKMQTMLESVYLILLVLPEQDVEGACEAPHCEHQQEQEPLDIL